MLLKTKKKSQIENFEKRKIWSRVMVERERPTKFGLERFPRNLSLQTTDACAMTVALLRSRAELKSRACAVQTKVTPPIYKLKIFVMLEF